MYDFKPQFCLEIPKAVCLSFDWVPKLIQKVFQPWSKNQFNAVRLRSLRMLAMPHIRIFKLIYGPFSYLIIVLFGPIFMESFVIFQMLAQF